MLTIMLTFNMRENVILFTLKEKLYIITLLYNYFM